MKIILLLFFIAIINNSFEQSLLPRVRGLYSYAGTQEDSAQKMFDMLKPVTETGEPVLLAYKGAVTMVQAKYSFNPLTKFGCFKRGKKLVEKAISQDSANIEIHYLRFTLQSNLPSFLGYSGELKADKNFLVDHFQSLNDPILRDKIISFLLTSKYCSYEDVKLLQYARRSSIGK